LAETGCESRKASLDSCARASTDGRIVSHTAAATNSPSGPVRLPKGHRAVVRSWPSQAGVELTETLPQTNRAWIEYLPVGERGGQMKKIITAMATTFLLAACTSSGSEDPGLQAETTKAATPTATPTPADPAEGLEDAVETYSNDFLSGRGVAAYDQLTQKCKDSVAKSEFISISTEANDTYGNLPIKSYEADVEGTVAKVTYTYDNAEIDQTDEQWIKEDGVWKNDDC
jgi:hypothetical protein